MAVNKIKLQKKAKWYYMSDTLGNLKMVGLYPAKRLWKTTKARKKVGPK